ncbi:hypothetical protein NKH98_32690, partial [Mesorhizobium sp. M0833]
MRFPDVLQGFLKKIEVGRLLSDETLQFADPSQCLRKLVKRFRRQCRRCTARVMRLTQPAYRSRRTHATAQSCWPACTKLLLPLIETLARDAELPRQLAHVGARSHALHRSYLEFATEPPPRVFFPHQLSLMENCYPSRVSESGCTT